LTFRNSLKKIKIDRSTSDDKISVFFLAMLCELFINTRKWINLRLNNSFISTVTTVTGTRLNVTFIVTLLVLFQSDAVYMGSQIWTYGKNQMPLILLMLVSCDCCVFLVRGLCDELITRPEESYRMWCVFVCDLETSWMRKSWPTGGCRAKNRQTNKQNPKDWDQVFVRDVGNYLSTHTASSWYRYWRQIFTYQENISTR
jgi:hypothetical protein